MHTVPLKTLVRYIKINTTNKTNGKSIFFPKLLTYAFEDTLNKTKTEIIQRQCLIGSEWILRK